MNKRKIILEAMNRIHSNLTTYSCCAIAFAENGAYLSSPLRKRYEKFFEFDDNALDKGLPSDFDDDMKSLRLTMLALFLVAEADVIGKKRT